MQSGPNGDREWRELKTRRRRLVGTKGRLTSLEVSHTSVTPGVDSGTRTSFSDEDEGYARSLASSGSLC